MRSTRIIFPGWILILLLKKHNTAPPECPISKTDDLLVTNCSGVNLYVTYLGDVFPPLDPKTDVLYFSNLTVQMFSAANLSHFKHLRKLYFKHSQISSFNETTLLRLKYLTHLDMNGTRYSSIVNLRLPKNLKVINFNNGLRSYINVLDCVHLEELYAGENLSERIPLIDLDAPLTYLDLDNNKQINITAEDLAPYCLLKYLGLAFDIEVQHDYCQCMRLQEWLKRFEIKTNYAECHTEESPKPQCDFTFASEVLRTREDCLKKRRSNLFKIVLAVVCSLVAIVIVTIIVVIIVKRKMTSEESSEEDED